MNQSLTFFEKTLLWVSVLSVVLFSLATCSPAFAASVSKADQIATIEHLRRLVKDSEAQVVIAKNATTEIQIQADKIAGERDWWQNDSARKEVAIKRYQHKLDVLGLLLSAAAGGLAFFVLGMFTGYINPVMAAYSLAGRIVLSTTVSVAVYTWVRFF